LETVLRFFSLKLMGLPPGGVHPSTGEGQARVVVQAGGAKPLLRRVQPATVLAYPEILVTAEAN